MFARISGVARGAPVRRSLPSLPPDAELAVYRIAQESLTNVARHAEATHVTIALERGLDSVVLRIVDDGRGFGGTPVEHGGLRGMRERALLIGGALAIKAGGRRGCRGTSRSPRRRRRTGRRGGLMPIPLVTRILIADDHPSSARASRRCSTRSRTSRSSPRPRTAHEAVDKALERTSTSRSSTSRCRA